MLVLLGMQSISALPSLSGPLWPGLVAPDRILSMAHIDLNRILTLKWTVYNRTVFTLTSGKKPVFKQMYMCKQITIYL